MGLRRRRIGTLADGADGRPFVDDVAAKHLDRAELQQRHGVTVGGLDRDRAAAVRDGTDERDRPGHGSEDSGPDRRADVDAAVLTARVRIGSEREGTEDRAVERPSPSTRGRCGDERREGDRGGEYATHAPPTFDVVEGNSRPR